MPSRATKLIHSIQDYRSLRREWFKKDLKVGFIPTVREIWSKDINLIFQMGALHEGHASLAALARKECDIVVSSIFVNPAQFAPTEDLEKYPKTLDHDIKILSKAGADFAFVPTVNEMYPAGIPLDVQKQVGTFVTVQGKSHQMEGQIRPHFFRGVATVVSKLFNIIQPTTAYFGQKDVQQCSVVRTMVKDLHFPIDVVVGETIRESDGLAISSRNRFLSPQDRKLAPLLYKGLQKSISVFDSGIRDRKSILSSAQKIIEHDKSVKLEYLSLAEPIRLEEVDIIDKNVGAILSGAVIMPGGTRIIDNVLLGMKKTNL